jgi:hypothetical protein
LAECPSCRTVFDRQPKFCENCGYQFASDPKANASPPSPPQSASRKLFVGLLLVVVAFFVVKEVLNIVDSAGSLGKAMSDNFGGTRPAPISSMAPTPARPKSPIQTEPSEPLELVNETWDIKYGHAILDGLVRNTSSEPLKNVMAVVSFYDAHENFITSSHALIEYNPILSGQASPFKVIATEYPASHSARIEFKELMGGTIPYRRAERKRGNKR